MRQKIFIAMGCLFVLANQSQALVPIEVNKTINTKILVVTATPTPTLTPIKLIKPSIKIELATTPKATVTIKVTPTPTEEIVTPTVTATPTSEQLNTPTPIVKEVTQEKIPSYILIIIGALIGIIVVQAWPKKPQV